MLKTVRRLMHNDVINICAKLNKDRWWVTKTTKIKNYKVYRPLGRTSCESRKLHLWPHLSFSFLCSQLKNRGMRFILNRAFLKYKSLRVENKARPLVLPSIVQQTYALREFQTKTTERGHRQWSTLSVFGILSTCVFLNARLEPSRSGPVFKWPKLCNNFVVGKFC